MKLLGIKMAKKSARWLSSRFVDGALILGYHRIAEALADPYSMRVTPGHFAQQLEILRKYAHPISSRRWSGFCGRVVCLGGR